VEAAVAELTTTVTLALEVVAIAIILGGLVFAVYAAWHAWRQGDDRHHAYLAARRVSARSILFALEVLLAADIIHTTAIETNIENMAALGLLVLIRTFLAWSIDVDLDGYWPWQRWKIEREAEAERNAE
jgi:uncharacterized membrane protein